MRRFRSGDLFLKTVKTTVLALTLMSMCYVCGCATSARPIPITKRVALMPTQDEVSMQARPGAPIGTIIPVDVSIANGTGEPYLIVPSQVFAIDREGERVLTVAPSEAIQEAGDANALKAGLTGAEKNAAVGAVAGALIGAAIGVAAGALVGAPGLGAAYGAALGGGVGVAEGGVLGGVQGQAAAHQDAETQINALSLAAGEAALNFSVNGYVFFPKDDYTAIQINVLNSETHQSEILTAPWSNDKSMVAQSVPPDYKQEPAPPVETPGQVSAPPPSSSAMPNPDENRDPGQWEQVN